MDGLLIVDKPAGPTSHDVVARTRRILREPRIGHTGTLDPAATGVLPLVVGRATRLARFLSERDKSYEAVVRLGVRTDTADAEGAPVGPAYDAARDGQLPGRAAIDAVLDAFRGTFLQQPPAFSAKRIGGTRSHELARARAANARLERSGAESQPERRALPAPPDLPAPVSVTAHAIDIVSVDGDWVTLRVDCSAGFYVRALAQDLGERLGVGAHLAALRRTRSGDCRIEDAMALSVAEGDPAVAVARLIPLSKLLLYLPLVRLTAEGARRARHGRDVGPADAVDARLPAPAAGGVFPLCRLMDPSGDLLGLAEAAAATGFLHPSIVLV
jgi:tRNA pseudouridine55 synthase